MEKHDIKAQDVYSPEIANFTNWYHGTMDRRHAEILLKEQSKPHGYLVRKSPKQDMQNFYVLSFCLDNYECEHFSIACHHGVLEIGGVNYYDVRDILKHFTSNNLKSMGQRLQFPVPPKHEIVEDNVQYLRAIHSYKATTNANMSFYSDDIFIVRPAPEYQDWLFVESCSSLVRAYVLADHVEYIHPPFVSMLDYFHTDVISPQDLKCLLARYGDGSFLIRPSDTQPGCYTVRVYSKGCIKKFHIHPKALSSPPPPPPPPSHAPPSFATSTPSTLATAQDHSIIHEHVRSSDNLDGIECSSRHHHDNDNHEHNLPNSTINYVFLVSDMQYSFIEDIVENYKKYDTYAGGFQLIRPVTRSDALAFHNSKALRTTKAEFANEDMYEVLRRASTLPKHPDAGRVCIKSKLYLMKKKLWKMVSAELDESKQLLLLQEDRPNSKLSFVRLQATNFYPLHESLHNCPYMILLATAGTHERSTVTRVLSVLDPDSKQFRKDECSMILEINPQCQLGMPNSQSGVNFWSINTVRRNHSIATHLDSYPSRMGSISSGESDSCNNVLALGSNVTLSTTTMSDLITSSSSTTTTTTPFLRNSISPIQLYRVWYNYLNAHCCNGTPPFHATDATNPSHQTYREIVIHLSQLSGSSALLKAGHHWSCIIAYHDGKTQHSVCRSQFMLSVDRDSNRREVPWKEDFILEDMPSNVMSVIFNIHVKKKGKKECDTAYSTQCTLQSLSAPWDGVSTQIQLSLSNDLRLTLSLAYTELEVFDFHYYRNLIDILMDDIATELVPICGASIQGTRLHLCMLQMAIRKGKTLKLIHHFLRYEWHRQTDKSACLRQDNLVTSILREYLHRSNAGWLRVCLSCLVETMFRIYLTSTTPTTTNNGIFRSTKHLNEENNGSGIEFNNRPDGDVQNNVAYNLSDDWLSSSSSDVEIEDAMIVSLVDGINHSLAVLPLQLRQVCYDLANIIQSSHDCTCLTSESATTSMIVLSHLVFLRFICPPLVSICGTASTLAGYSVSNIVEQLWALQLALYNQKEQPSSLLQTCLNDHSLSQDEFLSKHFREKYNKFTRKLSIDINSFPVDFFQDKLCTATKFITQCSKQSKPPNVLRDELRLKLLHFLQRLEEPLSDMELKKLKKILNKDTSDKLVPGWSREMAELQAILLHNLPRLEAIAKSQCATRSVPPVFHKLLPYLRQLSSKSFLI